MSSSNTYNNKHRHGPGSSGDRPERPRSNHSWLWMNEDLANGNFYLQVSGGCLASVPRSGTGNGLSPKAAPFNPKSPLRDEKKKIPLHAVVFASASEYFRANILNWQKDRDTARHKPVKALSGVTFPPASAIPGAAQQPGILSTAGGPSQQQGAQQFGQQNGMKPHQQSSSYSKGYESGRGRGPGSSQYYTRTDDKAAINSNNPTTSTATAILTTQQQNGEVNGSSNGGAAPAIAVVPQEPELVITEKCTRDQEEAALDVLEFLYTNQLKPHRSVEHILTMLYLAETWRCMDCVDACLEHFEWIIRKRPEHVDIGLVNVIMGQMPLSVPDHPCIQRMKQSCVHRLSALFNPAPTVLTNPSKLGQFCHLELKAVILWLQESSITVDSENTIIVLLTYWYWTQLHVLKIHHTKEDLIQLTECVRLMNLSSTFVTSVLQELQWFQVVKPDLMKLFRQLYIYPPEQGSPGPKRPMHLLFNKLPPRWSSSPRTRLDSNCAFAQWSMPIESLEAEISAAVASSQPHDVIGPCLYWGGFLWRFVLQFSKPAGKHNLEGTLGFTVLSAFSPGALATALPTIESRGSGRSEGGRGRHRGTGFSSGGGFNSAVARDSSTAAGGGGGSGSAGISRQASYSSTGSDMVSIAAHAAVNGNGNAVDDADKHQDFGSVLSRLEEVSDKLDIPDIPVVSVRMALGIKERATWEYRTHHIDASAGMLMNEMVGRTSMFGVSIANADDLSPYLSEDKLQMTMHVELYN